MNFSMRRCGSVFWQPGRVCNHTFHMNAAHSFSSPGRSNYSGCTRSKYIYKQSCWREQRSTHIFRSSRSGKVCAALGLQEAAVRGSPEPMKVRFREVDTFSLWIWFELHQGPSDDDLELLDAVLSSWFMIGRLGGFNAMNLQAMYVGDESVSFMKYEHEHTESALQAVFHDMGSVENKGKWCRCWFDLGTSDELALDVLINALLNFSRENVGIKQCIIGGVNTDWPIPSMQADS